ncbi:nucleocapsid protein [Fatsia japonica ringspot-associated virus]|uniref:Nucleoprotein n=1 Tax=Fatsia japonica ringspot-associated virus TaxID=2824867 RepID=A0AAD1NKU4_9VIRU|nr:nucleocapsid protein [Fatsia japonica ringspot-associated virus]
MSKIKVKNDKELFESLSKNAKIELAQDQASFTFKKFFADNNAKVEVSDDNVILFINNANKMKAIGKESNVLKYLGHHIAKSSPGVNEFTWSRMDSLIRMKYIERVKDYNEDKMKAENAKLTNWLLDVFNLHTDGMTPRDEVIFKVVTGGNLNHFMGFKTTFAHAFAIANYQHKRSEELGIVNFDTKAQLDRMVVIGEKCSHLPSPIPKTLIEAYFKNAMPRVKNESKDQSSKYNDLQNAIGSGEL